MKQPEALCIAESLEKAPYACHCTQEAAAELRRLDTENADMQETYRRLMRDSIKDRAHITALEQDNKELLGLLQHILRCIPYGGFVQIHDGSATVADINAAIAKHGANELFPNPEDQS